MNNAHEKLLNGYKFAQVFLGFENLKYENVFAQKNNKTLSETLEHKRYLKLRSETLKKYNNMMGEPLGGVSLI